MSRITDTRNQIMLHDARVTVLRKLCRSIVVVSTGRNGPITSTY
jgi:hypothetical protein